MVFVITDSVRGDTVHFLLGQGRLKNGIPWNGLPPEPNQKCKCIYCDTPHPPQTSHSETLHFILVPCEDGERRPRTAVSGKLHLLHLGNGSHISLSCTNSPWAPALEGFHFIVEKSLALARAYNSRTWSLCQPSEFSSQPQPVFCISSFQMDL